MMKTVKLMSLMTLVKLVVTVMSAFADEGPSMLPIFGDHSRCISSQGTCGWQFGQRADGYSDPDWVYHPGWDMNLSNPSDAHQNLYAIADGTVILDQGHISGNDVTGDWWGVLVIQHNVNGQTFYSQYGHIEQVFVHNGQQVKKGNRIAKVGNKGSGAYHLHWEIRTTNHSNPQDQDYWNDNLQNLSTVTSWYSDPEQFVAGLNIDYEASTHDANDLGQKNGDLHWWHGLGDGSDGDIYTVDRYAKACYIQDYHNGSWGDCAIVFDALGGSRRAFTVHSAFWSWWQDRGEVGGSLGMPLTNEYQSSGGGVRQDFQKGYLLSEGGQISCTYYHDANLKAPGEVSGDKWNNQYSYLFAHAYERNGGAVTVGLPQNHVYPYGDYGYLRQDFSGGTFGNCCIMYDPNNGAGNELATNEAYLIRTGFYDYYQAHGGSALGCPTRDEYSSRDPENWNDPTEYPLQNFFDREAYENGEASQHYMIWKNGVASYHSAYTTAYVSQTPSGQFNMQQGTSRAFTVKFRNTGSNTWYNSSSHLDGYVELKSCDASGTVMGSFLYYTTWLNNISPCTMQEASVAPGDVATFTFTGKVATNATVGLHNVYFRVNHSVGGLMTDWGGMHFQVNVTAIPVYSCQYVSQSPVGQFNFGEGTTQLIYVKFKNTGNTTWRKSASSYPNDFVKLVSCNSSGSVVPSFFNKPYDDTQGWIDDENVCTFVETSVAPGGTGTFRFTARVQEGQSPGLYNVYFRVHHATGGLLSDWAGMHFQPNVPKSYSTDFVSRSPTGTIAMSPGQTKTFTLKFKNTGNTTWRKSASSYPNDYVEIKSCDDDGVKCASFLNWPYTSSLGWLNYESPCTFTEASVAPGGTATFTFTGKVASGTSAGTRYVYFRPNHSKAGLLPGWEGGYFIISVSGSGKVTAEGLPTEFSLHQNYPNPFNPTTTISYSLPQATGVKLEIFNILGQCVQTLVDEHQSAGEHSVLWTSSGFSSGIYLYRIQTDEAIETKKMILLK